MTAASTPDQCPHPHPVVGVMAHEFAHYPGAVGPEGPRRTVTYFGPVIGGLPIDAWHCEQCGLLRLSYPDGRKEERRLYPGPQPDLLAVATTSMPEQQHFGMQAHVSGLSASPHFMSTLQEPPARTFHLPHINLPNWDAVTWTTVVLLGATVMGLFWAGILAVAGYQTPDAEGTVVAAVALCFSAAMVVQIGAATMRHYFPAGAVRPSVATSLRGTPSIDGTTRVIVGMLIAVTIGIFVAGILAVYDYQTPGAELPVVFVVAGCFVAAAVVALYRYVARHTARN